MYAALGISTQKTLRESFHMKNAVFALGLWLSQAAMAQPLLPGCDLIGTSATHTEGSDAMLKLLRANKYVELDALLNTRFHAYQEGRESDLMLGRDLNFALKPFPELDPSVAQWVEQFPTSFFSNLAAGWYQQRLGNEERGNEFSNKTSRAQFEDMAKRYALATPYLQKAATLNPKSALPFGPLLVIAASHSINESASVLNQAIKADPKNLSIRAWAPFYFSPRWGGSFEALRSLVAEARDAKLQPAQVRYLAYSETMEQGDHFWGVDANQKEAVARYKQALAMCPNSEKALNGLITNASKIKDWESIRQSVSLAETADNTSPKAFRLRGFAFQELGQPDKALADFERGAQLKDPWSIGYLGYLSLEGKIVPKDWDKARTLLTYASILGDKFAEKQLDWLNSQPKN
jgi:TPR repeat protein